MSQQNKYRDADKNLYSLPLSLKIKSVDEVEITDTSVPTLDLEVGEMIISKEITLKEITLAENYVPSIKVTTPGTYVIVAIPKDGSLIGSGFDLNSIVLAHAITNNYLVSTITNTQDVTTFTFPIKYLNGVYSVYKTIRAMIIRIL